MAVGVEISGQTENKIHSEQFQAELQVNGTLKWINLNKFENNFAQSVRSREV